ncbi:hypothetical protein [Pandoraea sp. PE-S2R-1]|uniref:hypothetical protein n=1 Tax=Pandoraea sp. PE-S2R-1 TaxID=1986994 RepID=UPI00112FE131|nr:hypothetical protein [Pandoraea sp. PE-S2R-1]
MSEKTYIFATGAFAVAVGLLAAIAVCWLAKLAPVDNSALASWAQAVGTVAAIGATIWLATRDSREKRDAEASRARMTAASILYRIGAANAMLQHVRNQVVTAIVVDQSPEYFQFTTDQLRSVVLCTAEVRLALLPLAPRAAFYLAVTSDHAGAAMNFLASAASEHRDSTSELRRGAAKMALESMNVTVQASQVVMQDLEALTRAESAKHAASLVGLARQEDSR